MRLARFIPLLALIVALAFFSQNNATLFASSPIGSNCSRLTNNSGSIVNGTAKNLTFGCGTKAAFRILKGGNYVPTFNLPSAYSSIAVSNGTSFAIFTGSAIHLSQGSYRYVIHYGGALTSSPIGSFTVTWQSG